MKYLLFLLLLVALSCSAPPHLTILYFNDAHEIAPVTDNLGQRGGVARLQTIVDAARKNNPHTMVIFGGDLASGTLFGGFYRGLPIVDAFNRIPVDVANLGQHDFDFGADVTRGLIDASNFQWFTSNLRERDGSPFHDLPAVLRYAVAGFQLGLLGLTDAMDTTTCDDVEQMDLLAATAEALSELENVDVIIAVTQTTPARDEQLLLAFPQIAAILSEERSENRTSILYVGDRPILSPCGNMGSVARLDISRRDGRIFLSTAAIAVDSTVAEDPALAALQKQYQDSLEQKLNAVIATSAASLDAGIDSDMRCRWGETTIGNLVADAFRHYHAADVAVINGGGLRASIPVGAVTTREVLAALPFGNKVPLVTMTGRALWQMFEHGLSEVENSGGQFLQISGGSYSYDWSAPAGARLLTLQINGEPLDVEKRYQLALPSYILLGGDDFDFRQADVRVPAHRAPTDVAVVRDFLMGRELHPALEGRIIVVRQ
ncbi:bifunctional metallophosphatase/5'-nucleotidase [candidate division KSB1 bacterium]|nr:bifunctional metallophosphatase/5'-nucleotidase [candidate division KSB1 bacterium]RQW02440.1 MAG: bifunctional metallophosphatase/5'-nucleotidase [candidate division KSB1 bacterium]